MSRKFVYLAAVCVLFAMVSSGAAQELGKGKVLFEYWLDIGGGTSVDNDLRTNANFPDNPSQSEWRDSFKSPADWADNTGTRARAFLTPPETGDYTFWIAGDDNCQLWLSTDANAVNATMIAQVAGWTPVDDWLNTGGGAGDAALQKSAPQALVAGQTYYIEALMKEGGGGDSVSVAWGGPGIGDGPVLLAGTYCTAFVRSPEPLLQAQRPDPASGSIEITNPLFQWTAGITAVMHDVYFGTDPNLGPDTYKGRQPFALYFEVTPLVPAAKYYWRVDEIEADGTTVYTGNVWTFTVMPVQAYNLSPYAGALNRNLNTKLSWKAGNGAVSHDVYLDVNEANVAAGAASALQGSQEATTFDPNGLAAGTTYYWRVDEVDSAGAKVVGNVLSFSTASEGAHGAQWEVWSNIGGTAVSDLLNDVNYPRNPDQVNQVLDFESPTDMADNYGGRLRAWLNVPAAGDYTFWVGSDDASKLYIGKDPTSAEQIAEVTGWTSARAWDWEAGQKSAPITLEAGKYFLQAILKEGGGGDNLSAAWQGGPILEQELIIGGFLEPYVPFWVDDPKPVNGDANVPYLLELSWQPGIYAAAHNVYAGTDEAAVANADTSTAGVFMGQTTENSVLTPALSWGKTYYWRVDEVNDASADSPWKGPVWSFSVADYIPIADAITVDYDNTVEPFVSEESVETGLLTNWTANGASSLQVEILGGLPKLSVGSDGAFVMQGAGADVWGSSDEFRYAYKSLTGDGSIQARVVAIGAGSSTWAKGGVMIRSTLDANSPHMIMALTGGDGGGIAFQGRQTVAGNSSSFHGAVTAEAPFWVKLTREGNSITGYYAADDPNRGVPDVNDWQPMTATSPDNSGFPISNPVEVNMPETVYVGLFVTSHAAGELRTFTFDNVTASDSVTGDWQVADVGVAQGGNDAAPLYVTVEDSAGAKASVQHPDNPNTVLSTDPLTWKVLLSRFSGVDVKNIVKFTVGVGDGTAGGTGSVQVLNARVVKPIALSVESSFKLTAFASKQMLTDYVIVEGEAFQVDAEAYVSWGAVRDDKNNVKVSLYYDDDGTRVSVASASTSLPWSAKKFSTSFSSVDVRKAVGHKLGVEFTNLRENSVTVQNVSLKMK